MSELTQWFYVADEPARTGWYEYSGWLLDEDTRLYWNGIEWGYWIGPGEKSWVSQSEIVTDRWRGLKTPNAELTGASGAFAAKRPR